MTKPDIPIAVSTDIPPEKLPALRLFRDLYETFDRDVADCFRYVEPTQANITQDEDSVVVHSVEFYRLHLDICAAIDSLLHEWYDGICRIKDEPSLQDYLQLLDDPRLGVDKQRRLKLKRNQDIVIQPWATWTLNSSPRWWADHNKTKHGLRPATFPLGNISNVVYALGAFYLLISDSYTRSTQPVDSKVFVNLF